MEKIVTAPEAAWAVIAVISAILGLGVSAKKLVGDPMSALKDSIQSLIIAINTLNERTAQNSAELSKFEAAHAKVHDKLDQKIDEQDNVLSKHETAISLLQARQKDKEV